MLLLGFAALALVVVWVVVAATSLYLEHTRLYALADSTALAAAETFSTSDVVIDQGRLVPRLGSGPVWDAAAEYVTEATATSRFDGLRLVAARSPDARSAEVVLTSRWRPPMVGDLLPAEVAVTVTSRARVVLE